MSSYFKNILTILYDEMTSRVYSKLKSAKKITKEDLIKKLREEEHYDDNKLKDLFYILGRLEKQNFIIIKTEKKALPKEGVSKYTKGNNRIENIIFKNPSIKSLRNKYEDMKKRLRKDFKEKETKKYQCIKCGIIKDENNASRSSYICPNCENKYIVNYEDVTILKKM